MLNKLNYTTLLWLFSIAVLVSAFILQFIFGILPCKLCLYQRIPYYIIIISGLCGLLIKYQLYEKIFLWLCVMAFFVNAILAFYHMGIEYGYFNNILNCVSENAEFNSVQQLKSSLIGRINIPCEVTSFKFILSLSGWNFFISLALGFLTLNYILRKRTINKI